MLYLLLIWEIREARKMRNCVDYAFFVPGDGWDVGKFGSDEEAYKYARELAEGAETDLLDAEGGIAVYRMIGMQGRR